MGQAIALFMVNHGYIFFIAVIGGIIGAETRNSLSVVTLVKHQYFHHLSKKERKELSGFPFRRHRYLIGSIAAFVSIVSLGFELGPWKQMVMSILVSLGGSSFLSNRIEGERIGDIDEYLNRAVDEKVEQLKPRAESMSQTAGGRDEIHDIR